MSTGPEHYREAEQLAATAARWAGHVDAEHEAIVTAINANTRATLALAAATAAAPLMAANLAGGWPSRVADEWAAVINPPKENTSE